MKTFKLSLAVLGMLVASGSANATQILAETVNLRPDSVKSLCMDFSSSAKLAACNGADAQKIVLTRRDTPAGERIMRVGNQCIEGNAEGEALFLAPCRPVVTQTWTYSNSGQVQNGNGLCIDVWRAEKTPNTPVIAYRCTGQVNQRWAKYAPAERTPNPGEMRNMRLYSQIAPQKCLDVTPDKRLILWGCHGQRNQQFSYYGNSNNTAIRVDGRCLTAPASGEGPIIAASCGSAGPTRQNWSPTGNGEFKTARGLCMDVKLASTSDGAEIIAYRCTGNPNQRFGAQ